MTGDYFLEGAKKGRSSIFVSAKLEGTGKYLFEPGKIMK